MREIGEMGERGALSHSSPKIFILILILPHNKKNLGLHLVRGLIYLGDSLPYFFFFYHYNIFFIKSQVGGPSRKIYPWFEHLFRSEANGRVGKRRGGVGAVTTAPTIRVGGL